MKRAISNLALLLTLAGPSRAFAQEAAEWAALTGAGRRDAGVVFVSERVTGDGTEIGHFTGSATELDSPSAGTIADGVAGRSLN